MLSPCSRLWKRWFPAPVRPLRRPSRLRPTRRLRLEALEDRTLLSSSIPLDPNNWTFLGPAPLGSGAAAVSGRVTGLAPSPTDPSTYYLAAASGGVWKTTDAGNTWAPLTDGQSTLFLGAIAVAPGDPNTIYAGTGEANLGPSKTNLQRDNIFYGRGVLKSTDAGAHWTLVGQAQFDRRTISTIVVDPGNASTVYVAVGALATNGLPGNTGVWKSTDGGATWSDTTAGISTTAAFSSLVMDPSNSQVLYAGAGTPGGDPANGAYKTSDGGAHWSAAGNFPTGADARVGRVTLAIATTAPGTLYGAVTSSGQGGSSTGTLYEMVKSTDGGATWSQLSAPDYMGTAGDYDTALVVDPTNANVVYAAGQAGGATIIKSSNGGASWSDISGGGSAPHADHHALVFTASGKLLDGNDGGIWRLDNPNVGSIQWTDLNTNLGTLQFVGVALHPTNPNIAYGGSQDNGTEEFTDSLVWSQVQGGDGGFVRIDPSNPQTVYHTFFYQGPGFLERSDNGGSSWAGKTSGINSGDPANFYPPYVLDPSHTSRLLLGTNRVYETNNRADSWAALSTPLANGWTTNAPIDWVAVAPSDVNTIYAGAGGRIFVTTNHGATWSEHDPVASPSSTLEWSDILVNPADAQTAYAVASNFSDVTGGGHVFRTTNGGASWADVSGNLPDLPTWTLAFVPGASGPASDLLYVGTDDGVYSSTNGGTSWARLGNGLPRVRVSDVELNTSLQILAAGTHGRGLWELSTSTTDLNWSGGGFSGVPATADTGTPFTITRTYNVAGSPALANFTISYYASASGIPNPAGDDLLGSETISAAADKAVGLHTATSPALQFPSRGTYYVYAVLDSGNTVPETNETNNVFVAPQTVTVTGAAIVNNNDAGYTESGPDWQDRTTSLGYKNDLAFAPAGSGQDTASWQVTGLAAGTYDVEATWYAFSNRATNAPYAVYDGNALLGTVFVNQQAAPTGVAVNGFMFQSLSFFNIQSGTLKVVLSNNANGFVIADAVRVIAAPPQAIIDNGDAGYTELGPDWQDRQIAQGYAGDLAYAPAGTGQDTASWQATGLAAGTYDVEATWYAFSNRATNAPYNVYDGNTLLTPNPILVNQQQAPSGVTVNGFVFQSLGQFSIQSGTLKVVLSNSANGYVFADAVRAVPLPPPVIDLNWNNGGITGPTSADTGTPFVMGRTYTITGAPAPVNFTISYYASTHPTLGNPDDILLGSETISTAAGKAVGTHAGTSPALQIASPGTYYLYAFLDSGNAIAETNENNNVAQAPAQVVVSGPLIVDNGQPGYTESGPDWQDRQTSLGYGGNLAYAPAGTGQDTASWQVTGLPAGTYDVEVTWYAFSNRATNAPYNVYDGNTLLTPNPILVNQQQAPSGTTVNGFQFQSLGQFSIQSGTLRVVLSNNANGYVFADALRVAPNKPPFIVDNGQPGYAESGPDWQDRTTSLGYGGNLAYAPAGTGQDTASWQFTGLAAGTYDVEATWYAFSNRATNAPYNVYDGNTLLTPNPILVNQQMAPSGVTVNGFQFQSLGQFSIQSGTLKVVLSNNANGYVFADALRLAPYKVTVVVDNGQAGYTESGPDWQDRTTSLGYGGNLAYAPAGSGQDTVTWLVSNLPAGGYDVEVTWYAFSNRADNAPYSVYDGNTLLSPSPVLVNQQVAPSGTTVNGFMFQSLGTFFVQSGTLKVVLSNNADGYVIADALRVVQL